MEKRDKLFLATFLVTIALLVFFIGASITGWIVQTDYCDGSGCYQFCNSRSDCLTGKCCMVRDYGVCKADCAEEFQLELRADIGFDMDQPLTEQPAELDYIYVYMLLLVIVVIIGHLYYVFRVKKVKAMRSLED